MFYLYKTVWVILNIEYQECHVNALTIYLFE